MEKFIDHVFNQKNHTFLYILIAGGIVGALVGFGYSAGQVNPNTLLNVLGGFLVGIILTAFASVIISG